MDRSTVRAARHKDTDTNGRKANKFKPSGNFIADYMDRRSLEHYAEK
jgi:hypothetical protein